MSSRAELRGGGGVGVGGGGSGEKENSEFSIILPHTETLETMSASKIMDKILFITNYGISK